MITTITPGTTAKKINKLFANGGDFLFKKGTYMLDKILTVHSNTSVICEEGVILKRAHGGRMLVTAVDKDTTGYNGVSNVTWAGGTFKADTNPSSAIVIVIVHAKNVSFNGVTIDGCVYLHSFEINASSNVSIKNCTIKNQIAKSTELHKEAIQIDYAYSGGLSIKGATANSPCYDGTHCEKIEIRNCTFVNVPTGIGTHVVSEKEEYHTDITIKGCSFKDMLNRSIRLLGMKNVRIEDVNCNILVDNTNKAHTSNGKVKIPTRYNKNVIIGEVKIE